MLRASILLSTLLLLPLALRSESYAADRALTLQTSLDSADPLVDTLQAEQAPVTEASENTQSFEISVKATGLLNSDCWRALKCLACFGKISGDCVSFNLGNGLWCLNPLNSVYRKCG